MIDRATVDKIIDAARIVDVVGEFVTLKKSGVNYKGLCPFHDDRNPSFMVSPSKNICHCFVCGKGGTPANFLMEHEQITYPEALRWLAKKYNIEIVEKEMTDEEREAQSERESMFIVNEWAKDWFHDILKNDPDGIAIGKQYFRSRGIRDDIIEKFQLGYAPQKRDALALASKAKGYKPEFLVKTGLCIEGEKGVYDRYAGRAIFPWFNVSGKVVAFGGRVLDSRTKGVAQKYVNSPDSDIYHKERELYGIYQAKKAIVKEDRVFMVEGYTDVIAMHQAGIENVVANSGTALSTYQIHMLHRFTNNITLLYDGDEAGIHAAMRGTDMLLEEGMNIKVLLLPDGDDPDSFARKHSTEDLKRYIEENQTDFITFKSRLTVENVTDPVKRSEAIGGIVKSISVIPDQILRSTYLSDFAHRINMKEQTLVAEMNKYIQKNLEDKGKDSARQQGREPQNEQEIPQPQMNEDDLLALHSPTEQASEVEQMLVREIVRHGEEIIFEDVETEEGGTISLNVAQYVHFDLSQDGLSFALPIHNQILEEAVEQSEKPGFKAESYFCNHADVQVSQLATRLAIDRHQLGGRFVLEPREGALRQRVIHLVMDFRLNIVENRLKEIQRQLLQVGSDVEQMMKLLKEHKETKELRDELAKRLGTDLVV
ncbi:DNA primase [Prevotella communis]|uniref:DNA primase n=1 Tax=Prevotella communis TaxID=2913614 RepID=UPI001ED9E2CB|nr:DNA primase [Prevotella communis]UKK58764.1 DNA primase [Prevotella communis]UKK66703.1 DNA primase [Prevotella communis]UKK71157.1 DNA primase [Prevotella communis]